jgi:hypothetical protein
MNFEISYGSIIHRSGNSACADGGTTISYRAVEKELWWRRTIELVLLRKENNQVLSCVGQLLLL